jgi:hypothetical protein
MQASCAGVQAACLEAVNRDPELYTAFSRLCEQFNMQVSRIEAAPAGSHSNVLLLPPAARSSAAAVLEGEGVDGTGSPPPAVTDFLASIPKLLSSAIGSVSTSIVNYIDRMHVRLHRLVLRMRGIDPDAPRGDDNKGPAGPPAVDDEHNVKDALFTAATLLVIVGLLMRITSAYGVSSAGA